MTVTAGQCVYIYVNVCISAYVCVLGMGEGGVYEGVSDMRL